MKRMAMLGLAGVLAAGCASNRVNGAGGGSLAGTRWQLTAWSDSSVEPPGNTITAEFGEAEVSGHSAVNRYGGSYTITGAGDFAVGELRVTRMAGSEDAMRAESLYLDLLRQARKYSLGSTTLTLSDESNQYTLTFEAR